MLLLTYYLIRARASAPETHICLPQKCDISVWPIATPSAIIVNTNLHHTSSIKYILYLRFQKYCLKCTSD